MAVETEPLARPERDYLERTIASEGEKVTAATTPEQEVAKLNAEANALLNRAERAERRSAFLEAALRRIADEGPNRGLTPDFRRFAADALREARSHG